LERVFDIVSNETAQMSLDGSKSLLSLSTMYTIRNSIVNDPSGAEARNHLYQVINKNLVLYLIGLIQQFDSFVNPSMPKQRDLNGEIIYVWPHKTNELLKDIIRSSLTALMINPKHPILFRNKTIFHELDDLLISELTHGLIELVKEMISVAMKKPELRKISNLMDIVAQMSRCLLLENLTF